MLKHKNVLLVLGIIFIASNLRTPLTAVGPLVSDIRSDLGISNGMTGFLTTLPLLTFAGLSLLSSKLGTKIGNELAIFLGLIVLIAGILLRSAGGSAALFAGTFLIGMGIVVGNVLVPSIIKQKFPEKVGLLTSIFSISMSLSAGISSGMSVPLANDLHWGWRQSLLVWILVAVAAIIFWLPQLYHRERAVKVAKPASTANFIWHSSLAWQVAFFMGLQSFLFYCFIAWFPAVLQSHGLSMASAGWLLSFFQIIAIPASFIVPILADRLNDQRGITVISCLIYFMGLLGLLLSKNMILLTTSVALMGVGGGACISLAFTFIGLRSSNGAQAAELSGMAQSVGYLLAAAGPIIIGYLFDYTQTWASSIVVWLIITLLLLYAGLGAGRNRYIFPMDEPKQSPN